MDAVILTAGQGKRLRPLTDETPKSLLSICGKPTIEWILESLPATVERVVMVVHTHADQIRLAVKDPRVFLWISRIYGELFLRFVSQERRFTRIRFWFFWRQPLRHTRSRAFVTNPGVGDGGDGVPRFRKPSRRGGSARFED